MKRNITLLLILSMLSGCATNGTALNKQEIGTGIGAVLGGVAGSFVGNGAGKAVAVVLGTAVGGFVGNQVGAWLDEKDQEAISQASANALVSAPTGQDVVWRNPENGNTAIITPKAPVVEERKIAMVRNKTMAPLPKLDLIGETWDAKKAAKVRTAPSTNGEVVTSLKTGDKFTAVGKVVGEDWIVVARGKKTIGYISSKTVGKVEQAPIVSADNSTIRKASNMDTVEKDRAIDLDAADTVAQVVVANASCRVVDVKVSGKDGQNSNSSTKACKAADGAWEVL
ncbi:SH3 domain-containing protein [Methylomonas sp. AM2-LC]|uniref:SH3 domain-containing protein n=1 Tax=Methylomonas sp. AM2-LC TaxID=3153301 RepID=UPI003267259E